MAQQYLNIEAFDVIAVGDLKQIQNQLPLLHSLFSQIDSFEVNDQPALLT